MRKYRKEHPGIVEEIRRRSNRKHPETRLLELAKSRAKRKGLSFNLVKEDIVIPEKCPVFGLTLAPSGTGFNDTSPTLDRIDNSKGYIRGNVIVVSWRANRLKADATVGELKTLAAFYSQFEGSVA